MNLIVKTKYSLSGIISSALIAAIFVVPAFAEQRRMPRDNDDDYKLPIYMPKVAQPAAPTKVIFQDDSTGNDEMYAMPTKAAPVAAPVQQQAQPQYQQPIPAYQPQVQQYQPPVQQQQAQPQQYRQPPADADTYYRLPDQYNPQRNQQAPQQQQQPQQAAPSKGYYQKYDYNDTRDNATPNKNQQDNDYYPTYYY